MVFGVIAAGIALFALIMFATYSVEKKQWNNGACHCDNGFWKSFDMDSSGATGYSCTECDNTIWLGFDFSKNRGLG